LEVAICGRAAAMSARGTGEFHGYELAKQLADHADHRSLTGYGTLYRALSRLEAMGLLVSRAEDPAIAARERRPPRRLYQLTASGAAAAGTAPAAHPAPRRSARRRIAPA
jgi:DNA-binding PadR family transcriptional regulator